MNALLFSIFYKLAKQGGKLEISRVCQAVAGDAYVNLKRDLSYMPFLTVVI